MSRCSSAQVVIFASVFIAARHTKSSLNCYPLDLEASILGLIENHAAKSDPVRPSHKES